VASLPGSRRGIRSIELYFMKVNHYPRVACVISKVVRVLLQLYNYYNYRDFHDIFVVLETQI